ncbi:hypothetical protein HDU96_007910 [Phlyctochytrium bullatum]|nr:hypothetical protein HDU96_007910 [Phlyctochytrium bullatum]
MDVILLACNAFNLVAGILVIYFLPQGKRHQRIVSGVLIFNIHFIFFVRHLFVSATSGFDSLTLRRDAALSIDVLALCALVVFGGICFISLSVRMAAFLVFNCVATPLILFSTLGTYDRSFLKVCYGSIFYGFIALAGAVQQRSQERVRRQTYLLEKLLSSELQVNIDGIVRIDTSRLLRLVAIASKGTEPLQRIRHTMILEAERDAPKTTQLAEGESLLPPLDTGFKSKTQAGLRRIAGVVDSEDADFRERYFRWRQKGFLFPCRINMITQLLADALAILLSHYSLCNTDNRVLSPRFCGPEEGKIQVLRLGVLVFNVLACGAVFFPFVAGNPLLSQLVFLASQTLRAVVHLVLTMFVLQGETKDFSVEQLLSIMVNSLTTSVGIFMLYMWAFYTEFSVLLLATLVARAARYIRNNERDIYVLLLSSFLACMSQNVGTERETQHLFALQELAGWLSAVARTAGDGG